MCKDCNRTDKCDDKCSGGAFYGYITSKCFNCGLIKERPIQVDELGEFIYCERCGASNDI